MATLNSTLAIDKSRKEELSTLWLLSTLGSKATTTKRVFKKDILELSIPDTCHFLGSNTHAISLRMCSSMLYGISLAYAQKVNYAYSDVSLINSRISKELCFKSILPDTKLKELSWDEGLLHNRLNPEKIRKVIAGTPQDKVFLSDDYTFNIEEDLVPELEIEGDGSGTHDQRVLQLQTLDQQNNMDFENFTTNLYVSLDGPSEMAHLMENAGGSDMGSFSLADDILLDFDLDGENGEVRDAAASQDSHFSLDIDTNGEVIEKRVPQLDLAVNGSSINTDVHFSNTTESNGKATVSVLQLDNAVTKKRLHKVAIDSPTVLSAEEIRDFHGEYDATMALIKVKRAFIKRRKTDSNTIAGLMSSQGSLSPQFVNYCNLLALGGVFGHHINRGFLPTAARHARSGDDFLLNGIDDMEYGRNAQEPFPLEIFRRQELLNDIMENDDDGGEGLYEYIDSQMFDDLETRAFSRRSNQISLSEGGHSEDNLAENISVSGHFGFVNQFEINQTLMKFLKFTVFRTLAVGVFLKQNELSQNQAAALRDAALRRLQSAEDEERSYYKISFGTLMPSDPPNPESNNAQVTRPIAANAFLSTLDLATKNFLAIESLATNRPLKPEDINLYVLH